LPTTFAPSTIRTCIRQAYGAGASVRGLSGREVTLPHRGLQLRGHPHTAVERGRAGGVARVHAERDPRKAGLPGPGEGVPQQSLGQATTPPGAAHAEAGDVDAAVTGR